MECRGETAEPQPVAFVPCEGTQVRTGAVDVVSARERHRPDAVVLAEGRLDVAELVDESHADTVHRVRAVHPHGDDAVVPRDVEVVVLERLIEVRHATPVTTDRLMKIGYPRGTPPVNKL